jgi:hypothetical protein
MGVWWDGPFVVMRREAALPGRCVWCNQPISKTVPMRVTWLDLQPDPDHPLDNIPYLRLIPKLKNLARDTRSLLTAENTVIEVGLCGADASTTKLLNAAVWITPPAAILFAIIGAIRHPCLGFILFLPFLVVWAIALKWPRPVSAVHIGCLTITLRGAGKDFLASLPPWPEAAQGACATSAREAKGAALYRMGERIRIESRRQ